MLDDYVRHLADKGIVDRYDSLSEREREIFQLIAEGHSNKEIADLLSISPATVETHRAHILRSSTCTTPPSSCSTRSGAASSPDAAVFTR